MNWLFDTSVWHSLASRGGPHPVVDGIRHNPRNKIATSAVSIAELHSILARRGLGHRVDWVVRKVHEASDVLVPSEEVFALAGRIHAAERSHRRDFSLADAILLAQAKGLGAKLLTHDRPLFKNRQGVAVQVLHEPR
ncbi:MAG: PIN domain-containing protein [Euryarchaeota archaeon]|nr:PIN domain-containing protein [Euryarchaeota archaeon]